MSSACSDFLRQIKRYFDYLFTDYGFNILSIRGNQNDLRCVIILKSLTGLIMFERDRTSIEILLAAPHGEPEQAQRVVEGKRHWYSLLPLLGFLNQRVESLEDLLQSTKSSKTIKDQLVELSTLLRPTLDDLMTILLSDEIQRDYEEFSREQNRLFKKQYQKRQARKID
jgi:hypothetical protein